ncbi:hypothetical protein ABBQ38_009089 [Trebouxia sp. C0009 RCD-2024]
MLETKPEDCLGLSCLSCITDCLINLQCVTRWYLQRQDTAVYIKEHSKWSLQRSKQEPEIHLASFCADMTQLTTKAKLDLTDICNLLDVTGQLAFAARQPQKLGISPTTQQLLRNLVKLLCKQLWRQRTRLSATQAAEVLRALSRTGTHPDTMPGLADALAEQFIADSECHNAYRYIQALYSCAQMGIDPCEGRLPGHILQRFPKLSLAKVTPRMLTNMLFSVAAYPAGHHSLAAANTTALETKTAHKLCTRLTRMLKSSESEDQCTEDDVASSLRSLTALKHQPNSNFTAAFCGWYAQLLKQLQHESPPRSSHRLSIILAACVDLRLKLPASFISILTPHLLGASKPHTSHARAATCANAAWSLAALGILDYQTPQATLHAHSEGASPWSVSSLSKFYQALDWLQPESAEHPNHGRWSALHDQVAALAARPDAGDSVPHSMLTALHAVLDEESIAHSSSVQLGGFRAPVAVTARGKQGHMLIFDFVASTDYFVNVQDRLMGRAAFRQEMLGRHGTLVPLAQDRCQGAFNSSIVYIRERFMEAAADMGPTEPIGS